MYRRLLPVILRSPRQRASSLNFGVHHPSMKLDRRVIRLYAAMIVAVASLLAPASARAQFQPRPVSDPATGEQFHIEGAIGLWFPGTEMQSRARRSAIAGSTIDFKTDLGLEDQKFPELHLVAKGGKHKFRLQYIPLDYAQEAILPENDRLQRPALRRRPSGQLDARLEGLARRLRVRLHHPGSRLRRVHPGREVHGRERVARQPDSIGLRRMPRPRSRRSAASSASIRSRTSRSPARSRASRWLGPQLDQGRHERPLRGLRLLRHGELHEQRRRAGRLPAGSTWGTS